MQNNTNQKKNANRNECEGAEGSSFVTKIFNTILVGAAIGIGAYIGYEV